MRFSRFATRRDFIQGAAAAATVALSPARAAAAAAAGVVSAGEGDARVGLAGVLVTNGRDVVATDADGRYTLPIEGDAIISVIKPSGYAVPVEPGTNLERFFHIHQPGGTPASLGLSGPGVDPTGPLPASVDFHLARREEPSKFRAILFADPQPETDAEVDFIRDGVVAALAGVDAAFGLTLGDITGDNLSLYPRINALIGQIGIPWRVAIGNHDLNYEAKDDSFARETFKRTFGPTHYAFERGGALFIVLDNVVYHGADASKPGSQGDYHDAISPGQLRFVENVLRHTPKDRLVIIATHIPLKSTWTDDGREVATQDTAELLAIVGERPCVSFSGHTHMAEHRYILPSDDAPASRAHRHQVLATVSGSWWSGPYDSDGVAIADCCDGAPSGYYILDVDGATCQARFHPTRASRSPLLRAALAERQDPGADGPARLMEAKLTRRQAARTELVVNAFDGGPRANVSYRINGGAPVAMARDYRVDPFVADVYARNANVIKPWVAAVKSPHVWAAPLPAELAPGPHSVDVTATGEFGEIGRTTILFEIKGDDGSLALR